MQRLIIIIFVLLCQHLTLHAQSSYKVVFEGPEHGIITLIYSTSDEDFVVCKSNFVFDNFHVFSSDIYTFCNQNPEDTVRWNIDLHKVDTSMLVRDIRKLSNEGWLISGTGAAKFLKDTIEDYKYLNWMMELDQNKNIQWVKYHNLPEEVRQTSELFYMNVIELSSGNYLYAESVENDSLPWIVNILLREVTPLGDIVFTKVFDQSIGGDVMSLSYGFDRSTILLHKWGRQLYDCSNGTGAFILDTAQYDTIGRICYSGHNTYFSSVYNAMLHPNGELIVAGQYDNTLGDYIGVQRYDSTYSIINNILLTAPDTTTYAAWNRCLDINDQGEIIVAGSFDNALGAFTTYYDMVYVAKLDPELNLLSERYFSRDAEHNVFSVAGTSDGGVAVGGFQYDYLVNDYEGDPFVIKTDAGLWLDIPQINEEKVHRALLYPNPGGHEISVRTSIKQAVFSLFDMNGRLLLVEPVDELITFVNTSSLQEGAYLWTLTKMGQVCDRGKWIKY